MLHKDYDGKGSVKRNVGRESRGARSQDELISGNFDSYSVPHKTWYGPLMNHPHVFTVWGLIKHQAKFSF
jgi:hypothetical protein